MTWQILLGYIARNSFESFWLWTLYRYKYWTSLVNNIVVVQVSINSETVKELVRRDIIPHE